LLPDGVNSILGFLGRVGLDNGTPTVDDGVISRTIFYR
jgi:hypothetical protein